MAKQTRKKVGIQYRKLEDVTGGFNGSTLQAALSNCLKYVGPHGAISESVKVRQFDSDPAYGTLVLNFFEDKDSFFFGELVRFEPGADLPLLQLGDNVKAYNLTQAKAPAGHEPIRGVLYLLAVNNHAMVLESDLSASRAERYLTWLLSQATPIIAENTHIILAAELSPESGANRLSQVDQIILKPRPVQSSTDEEAPTLVPALSSTSRDVSETNTLDVLRAAGMDDTDIQSLVQDETSIEVVLQIRFKGKRKRRSLGIDDANRLLRNVPDDELTLSGPGGRQKNGKIVKLAYPANIELIGSLLDSKDVARALFEGYKYFVSNGYIDA
ncbi:hypothetical protein CN186_30155 [Sinorhizobium medicae]|uniref:hypothetical protein n=1 Tax=Sinorhizobium medicae TaxID=110321 RepID=UPI000FDCC8E5|nr:hypothetical protein [Sinorhizobium medicae]RVI87765.1 hypothetical protein CN186_30155 [Sinorhizobium medicae]